QCVDQKRYSEFIVCGTKEKADDQTRAVSSLQGEGLCGDRGSPAYGNAGRLRGVSRALWRIWALDPAAGHVSGERPRGWTAGAPLPVCWAGRNLVQAGG